MKDQFFDKDIASNNSIIKDNFLLPSYIKCSFQTISQNKNQSELPKVNIGKYPLDPDIHKHISNTNPKSVNHEEKD